MVLVSGWNQPDLTFFVLFKNVDREPEESSCTKISNSSLTAETDVQRTTGEDEDRSSIDMLTDHDLIHIVNFLSLPERLKCERGLNCYQNCTVLA